MAHYKNVAIRGQHSSVDLSAPTCQQSWVRISNIQSTLFYFIVKFCATFVILFRKKTKINKNEARFGPCFCHK